MSHPLLELAGRCERAAGPDREIDYGIYQATDPVAAECWPHWTDDERDMICARFTRSIDAAMTLIPAGWFGETSFGKDIHGEGKQIASMQASNGAELFNALGKTPALALCAAALRAMAAAFPPLERGVDK